MIPRPTKAEMDRWRKKLGILPDHVIAKQMAAERGMYIEEIRAQCFTSRKKSGKLSKPAKLLATTKEEIVMAKRPVTDEFDDLDDLDLDDLDLEDEELDLEEEEEEEVTKPAKGKAKPAPAPAKAKPAPKGKGKPAPVEDDFEDDEDEEDDDFEDEEEEVPAPKGKAKPAPAPAKGKPAPAPAKGKPAPAKGKAVPAPAKGKPAPAPAKGKAVPAKGNAGNLIPRTRKFEDSATITLEVEGNPKRGTAAARFELYEDGITVGEYLEAGGKYADILWDQKQGWISVK